MEKILVTTDLSANSKAGLRFAIQLASQHNYELTFFHSYFIMKPTSLPEQTLRANDKAESIKIEKKLKNFVASVYKSMNTTPKKVKYAIRESPFPDSNISEYALENSYGFICMSTRGGGTLRKIFGSNTSHLVNFSSVPVIVVPHNYRRTGIRSLLYLSDLNDLKNELKKVIHFANPLKTKVELLHFSLPFEVTEKQKMIKETVKKLSKNNLKLRLENINIVKTLITNIEAVVKEVKPSMLVMFTNQNRSFFEKIFLSSKTAEYSFDTKVPLLVFNKNAQ